MQSGTEYVLRIQSDFPYTYGVGELVADRVTLFRYGNWGLSLEEAQAKLKGAPKVKQ